MRDIQERVDGKRHYCWVFGSNLVYRVDVKGRAYGRAISMKSMAEALRLCRDGGEVKRRRGWS